MAALSQEFALRAALGALPHSGVSELRPIITSGNLAEPTSGFETAPTDSPETGIPIGR